MKLHYVTFLSTLFMVAFSGLHVSAESIQLTDDVEARSLKILREGLVSEEFWPAMHAAEALTLAGYGDEVTKAFLPKIAAEKDDQFRCGLARELVRAGDRSKTSVMLDILGGDDPHGYIHACESIYKVNEVGDGRLLHAAMAQENILNQKLMAAAALGRWGNPEAFVILREYLQHEDLETARIAAWILARIGDESDIPELRKQLTRATGSASQFFFEHALALLGDSAGQIALAKNLSHKEAGVRTQAATFAGEAWMTWTKEGLEAMLDDEVLDVRVRAAQSLLVMALPQPAYNQELITRDVYPTTKEHPRYSEGSIVTLNNGMIVYSNTEFSESWSDFAKAHIVEKHSADGGRTWSDSSVMQETTGKLNVMSSSLFFITNAKTGERDLGFFFLKKDSYRDLNAFLRLSSDEGKTFGDPILVTPIPGYHVMNNDRITQLRSGRLLAPVASSPDVKTDNHFKSRCFISDDLGLTWRPGKEQVDYAKRGSMEPEVLELDSGRVLMHFRTQLGHIAVAYSDDEGDTWSTPESWGVRAPEAPSTLRRIPSTGDLMLIWNDTFVDGEGHGGKRTPLTVAISKDEGKTWSHKRPLEVDPDVSYAYTSLTFHHGRALISYYVQKHHEKLILSRFKSIPIAWFYGKE